MSAIQTSKIETSLLLQCIEISDDFLVWKDFRTALGLRKKDRYKAGERVQATYGGREGERPYVRINIYGFSHQIPYAKVIQWVKYQKEPESRCFLADGDPKNLRVSNATSNFIGWWEIRGKDCPILKSPK